MKRLNPDTGKPFVRGDTRADGFLFEKYRLYRTKLDGFFGEQWLSPKSFYKNRQFSKEFQSDYAKQQYKSESGRAYSLVQNALKRCSIKNCGSVTITKEWVNEKIAKGFCEITGLAFDLNSSDDFSVNPYAPSLDRIDNSNPDYSPENTRVVLASVNLAINQFGLDIMLPVFKALLDQQAHN